MFDCVVKFVPKSVSGVPDEFSCTVCGLTDVMDGVGASVAEASCARKRIASSNININRKTRNLVVMSRRSLRAEQAGAVVVSSWGGHPTVKISLVNER